MKKFLCYDSGLYSELCNGLGKNGDSVSYYTPFHASFFPRYADYSIGQGFEHLTKIKYFFDEIDKSDCICSFEVGGNDLISFLRKHFPNKPVFGSGKGQKLEDGRWALKKVLKAAGLLSAAGVKVKGVKALGEYLKSNSDKYVKVDIFRGSINSFPAKDYKSVEALLKYIDHELGAFSSEFEFVVEDTIPTSQEWGVDTFFWGEDYVKPFMFGVELDKDSYIGKVVDVLPKPLQETMDKLKPVLKELDWRGCISTEEKLVSKDKHFFLDICARSANPLGLIYPEFIDNWPEMVYSIASKKPVKLETKVKYVGCVPLTSEHTKNSDVQVNFNPKYRKNIKFMTAYKKDNQFYAIKSSPEKVVAIVIAGDDTVDGLIKQLKKYADEVDCYEIDKKPVNDLDKIKDIISEAKTIGIDF